MRTTSTRRTIPQKVWRPCIGAPALAPLLDGSTAAELIPELVRHGLQQLIELEAPIDVQLKAFLNRPLQDQCYAYLFLDATYLYGRHGKAMQACSRAVVVSMGVNADGRRQLLGLRSATSSSRPSGASSSAH